MPSVANHFWYLTYQNIRSLRKGSICLLTAVHARNVETKQFDLLYYMHDNDPAISFSSLHQ